MLTENLSSAICFFDGANLDSFLGADWREPAAFAEIMKRLPQPRSDRGHLYCWVRCIGDGRYCKHPRFL
jgi:hypothetical protein